MKYSISLFLLIVTNVFAQKDKIYTSLEEALKTPSQVYKLKLEANMFDKPIEGDDDLYIVPESIGKLTNLKYLDISIDEYEFKTLPNAISQLVNLTELSIQNSRLQVLPEAIGSLVSLEKLYLNGNQLKTLPESIIKLTKLKLLALDNNPQLDISLEKDKLRSLVLVQGVKLVEGEKIYEELLKSNAYKMLHYIDNNDEDYCPYIEEYLYLNPATGILDFFLEGQLKDVLTSNIKTNIFSTRVKRNDIELETYWINHESWNEGYMFILFFVKDPENGNIHMICDAEDLSKGESGACSKILKLNAGLKTSKSFNQWLGDKTFIAKDIPEVFKMYSYKKNEKLKVEAFEYSSY